jgi:ribonuclease BN (tRNA processing enzyme)
MSKVIILGSASGMPVASRAHSSFVLEMKEGSYLFDVGEGCASSLLRHQVDHHRIFAAFVTHMHPDHVIGLPMLLQMMHLSGREVPLAVYLPAEAVEPTRRYLDALYIFPEKLPFEIALEPIRPNPIYRDSELTVHAFRNRHLEGHRALVGDRGLNLQMDSYSLAMLADGKKLFYSGDVAGIDDLKDLQSEPHLVITECMHVDAEELMALLAGQKVPRVVLTHVPRELEGKDAYLLQLAQKHGVRDVLVAHDGLSLRL